MSARPSRACSPRSRTSSTWLGPAARSRPCRPAARCRARLLAQLRGGAREHEHHPVPGSLAAGADGGRDPLHRAGVLHRAPAGPGAVLALALIASVPRIIVLTAERGELARKGGEAFRAAMIETTLIAAVIVALAVALVVLRKRHP